ncbi:MAG: TRAP transporter large permease [Lachnospiraceae bacterium]|nr:TRAP transporter large permease [Lachnospiraceae bacterium]MEE3457170.1 TRAP transporter large permease [Lachnospiraceae bacterium]
MTTLQAAALVLVVVFLITLLNKVPVSFSIILSALVTIIMFLTPQFGMFISAQKLVTGIDSFSLLAVPFFILAGQLMSSGGIAKRIIDLAMLILGKVPGSLALTNIAGNAMFGSLSGSGLAAATAIGGVMLPMEKEHGYDDGFGAATNIATAPVGQLIPPTNAPIVYSAAAGGTSVAALLMAGWIPGLLWAFICGLVAFVYATKHGYIVKRTKKLSFGEVIRTILEAIPSLLLIVIIIGGILSGYFTPTEASGVAVIYAFILAVFVYRSIKISEIPQVLVNAGVTTTIIMLIIGASSVLSFVLSFTGLPQAISSALMGISSNKIVILLIINVILLIVGTFMDMAPALLIFTPIFLPVARSVGMNDIQFGIMMIMNLAIGTITPPVGSVLFVGCSVAGLKIEDVIKSLLPYFAAILIALLMVTFIPGLSLWLPSVFGLV